MPNMRVRSKVAVTTQIPISTMELVDKIRDKHRIKITNLFEIALESYISQAYPDLLEEQVVEEAKEKKEKPADEEGEIYA